LDVVEDMSKIYVFGLCGETFQIRSIAHLREAVRKENLASILYVYSLVPLVRGAPTFPLCAFCHDSSNRTFSTDTVFKIWKFFWQVSI
jgi:hypothetical protein